MSSAFRKFVPGKSEPERERQMDLSTYKLIGTGNTADVFDIGGNKVLKLFHAGHPQRDVEREFQNSLLMNQTGLPIAKSYEMVSVKGRTGIVCDKIEGEPLLDLVVRTGEVERYTMVLAAFHKRILQKNMPAASDFKKNIGYGIRCAGELAPEGKEKLLRLLDTLPDGEALCHGDFHHSNVLWDGEQAWAIDFMDVCRGHRNFDIARTLYLTEFSRMPQDFPNREKLSKMQRTAAEIYLREMGVSREELSPFLMVTAARSVAWLSGDSQREKKEAILEYLRSQGIPIV